jgi:hypothetical protein
MVARAVALIGVMALVFIGLGFVGYAFYLAFMPLLPPIGAAAITAAILLAIPAIWIVVLALRAGGRSAPVNVDDNTLAMLAGIAKDKPLFAMLLAGLVGAAGAVDGKK